MMAAVPLTHGWFPVTVQLVVGALVLAAIGWRSRRWRTVWLPVAGLAGLITTALVYFAIRFEGLAGDPPPPTLWLWTTLSGLAAAVCVLGWRGSPRWRRSVSLVAVPMCVLCTAGAVNAWVRYFPTVGSAWDGLTGAPLPGQTDLGDVAEMLRRGVRPDHGTLVSVTTPDTAGFPHRSELIYLPPSWYRSSPPPRLPVIVMAGAEFSRPVDWIVSADAQSTIDNFAATHGGSAPILVFPDTSGSFNNDTECVNGTRGAAADHLTNDVVPYVISHFGSSTSAANWGIVGWSAGGTCALLFSVKHPELFSAFVDLDGLPGPNAGTRLQTIDRLFDGDADAWAQFDPATVVTNHGPYTGMAGWLAASGNVTTTYHPVATGSNPISAPDADGGYEDHGAVANYLCGLLSHAGIECSVVPMAGGHDFAAAGTAFAEALPWLAGQIGTPGIKPIELPGAR